MKIFHLNLVKLKLSKFILITNTVHIKASLLKTFFNLKLEVKNLSLIPGTIPEKMDFDFEFGLGSGYNT